MKGTTRSPRALSLSTPTALAVVLGSGIRDLSAQRHEGKGANTPIVIAEQGGFAFGGTVLTGGADSTLHCDHGYAQFQIPPNARNLPLVMWHSTSTKTWESSPGGPEGFQDIFLRRGFAAYVIDLPRQGRAGTACVNTTYAVAVGRDQRTFLGWRLGVWNLPGPPSFFANSQFPRDTAFLNQILRARYPDNEGFQDTDPVEAGSVAALLDKIGPATLITHSGSGRRGWLTAIRSSKVRGIVSFEPSVYVFPPGELPPPNGAVTLEVPLADFRKLTQIPILVIFGDYLADFPAWPARLTNGRAFVDALNRHGGEAQLLHLPEVGIFGNSHIMMLERNNAQIANLVSQFLQENGLDKRKGKEKDDR